MFTACVVLVAHCYLQKANAILRVGRIKQMSFKCSDEGWHMMDQGWESETQRCENIWNVFEQIHFSMRTHVHLANWTITFRIQIMETSFKCTDRGWHMTDQGWESETQRFESRTFETKTVCWSNMESFQLNNCHNLIERNLYLVCAFGRFQPGLCKIGTVQNLWG